MLRGRKLILCLFLCLAMVLPVCCLAQSVEPELHKIDKNRIIVNDIPGLVYDDLMVNGYAHLLIHTDETNWSKVMLNSGATTEVMLSLTIIPPTGFTKCSSITGNRWEDQTAILNTLKEGGNSHGNLSGMDRTIAAYTEEKQMLSPVYSNQSDHPLIHAIDWSNDQGEHWYEYMEIEFEHTSMLGRKVEQLVYDHTLLQTNTTGVEGVNVDPASSAKELIYTFDSSKIDLDQDAKRYIHTRLPAPSEKAVKLVTRGEFGNPTESAVENGYATFEFDLKEPGPNRTVRTGIWTERRSVLWVDEDGKVVEESGVLSITFINSATKLPWMAYISQYENGDEKTKDLDWNPVVFNQHNILFGYENDDKLIDVDYFKATLGDYGHVHIGLKDNLDVTLRAAQELSWCGIDYLIDPPDGAVSYTRTRNTRNNFYGKRQDAYDNVLRSLMSEDPIPLWSDKEPVFDGCPIFEPLNTPIEDVQIFSTIPETKPDFAGSYFYCWFDKDDKPISISYFIETADRIVLEPKTESYLTEVDVKHPVKGPVFIDGKNTKWKLRAEYHVQSGYNAYIVELYIEDQHGNPVDLKKELGAGEKIVFYLPYREHDDFSKYNFFLTHYEGGDLNNGVPVQVTPTDKGIRFEVDNLSPFVVSWDDASLPPAMSTQLPNFIVETEQLREPTEALIDAGFPTDEAIDEAVSAQLAGALPARGFMDVIEFVPKVRIEDGTWIEIENPDEMPDDGLYCEFAYPEGTSAATHDFVFFHMLGADSDEGKVGDIVPVPFEEKADCILLHMRSFSPVGYGYVETPVSPIPQTGDATPIWLYFSILTLSAGCILILRRKHA